ncbi:type II secretion system protein [Salipiger abyssi]|uniref:Type II secretion system protein H n=1 Tax=Salipiger abyssi TaxID=1250539 RepID=A0A1P8UXB5_9RHOB|nr:type II secretion system protein [Salipiger abyssi]APZ54043.1 prepilin-type N-terminal cleavage/methylation domain-containing protein [Salipiger abyssi]
MTDTLPRHDARGFTLIELLVVVAILSVLAIGVGLGVTRTGTGAPSDLSRFQTMAERARSLAITSRQSQGLWVDTSGLTAGRRRADGWEKTGTAQAWRGEVRLAATALSGGPAETEPPQIVFLATGTGSAYEIVFSGTGPRTRCTTDGWTELACETD